MDEERKGILTPDQEKILDKIIDLKNPVAEAADGVAIQLLDNQGLESLKARAEKRYPGVSREFIYPIIDSIMAGVEGIIAEPDN